MASSNCASGNAINGALDAFVVSNSGNNYNEFANGSVVLGTNGMLFTINSTSFTLSGNIGGFTDVSITTNSSSQGGSDPQTKESIRDCSSRLHLSMIIEQCQCIPFNLLNNTTKVKV